MMGKDDSKILKSNLEQYKELTLKLIVSVEKEDFDALDTLLEQRQNIISLIEQLNYEMETFKQITTELDLMPLQKKLTELMNIKKNQVKDQIEKLGENKIANKSYRKKFAVDSIYFNKKI